MFYYQHPHINARSKPIGIAKLAVVLNTAIANF